MSFERSLDFTLAWEGGYVNDPNDPGGETNYGISKRAHPDEDIKNMTRERAGEIYREEYWDRVQGDAFGPQTSLVLFDFAVHSGVNRASTILQRLVGVAQDGLIGPVTLGKAMLYEDDILAWELHSTRVEMLVSKVNDVRARKFMKGWMARTHALVKELYGGEEDGPDHSDRSEQEVDPGGDGGSCEPTDEGDGGGSE